MVFCRGLQCIFLRYAICIRSSNGMKLIQAAFTIRTCRRLWRENGICVAQCMGQGQLMARSSEKTSGRVMVASTVVPKTAAEAMGARVP